MKGLVHRILRTFGVDIIKVEPAAMKPFELQRSITPDPAGMRIFDVGAHNGSTGRIYRQYYPLATIISFEPFPGSYEGLPQASANDPGWIHHQLALGSTNSMPRYNVNRSSYTNSLLATDSRVPHEWAPLTETTQSIDVVVKRLDTFCEENRIDLIDIL